MAFSVFQKNQVFGYSWSTLLWHRCYYPHRSRDALSPVCGIFWLEMQTKGFVHTVKKCLVILVELKMIIIQVSKENRIIKVYMQKYEQLCILIINIYIFLPWPDISLAMVFWPPCKGVTHPPLTEQTRTDTS